MPRLALLLVPLLWSAASFAGLYLVTSQTNRETDLWETRINDNGSYETLFLRRGIEAEDPVEQLTYCGTIPENELQTLRETAGKLKRVNNGKVTEGYGTGKYPPVVKYYGNKEPQKWLGEKAQEMTTMIEDMTHFDPDMGLALGVAEWTPTEVTRYELDRDGKFLHTVTTKATDGGTPKVVLRKPGVVCREELRTLRKWMLEAHPLLKLAACSTQKTGHFFEFDIVYKTKRTTFKCDGSVDKLAPVLAGAFQQIKLTPFRSQLETK